MVKSSEGHNLPWMIGILILAVEMNGQLTYDYQGGIYETYNNDFVVDVSVSFLHWG